MSLKQAAAATSSALSSASFSSSSSSLVKQTLISLGPQTTQGLHAALHSSSSALPARPPPRNFLSGARRASLSTANSNKQFPGQEGSTDGSWTMSFLKKKVLHGMETRGEIVKMTRAKWERTAARAAGEDEASVGATEEGQSARSAKGTKHALEEHVWVIKTEFEQLAARAPSARERAERQQRDQEGENDLRAEYGLNSA